MATNKTQKVAEGLLIAVLAILPLFFLPFTRDFFDINKLALLGLLGAALLLLWLTNSWQQKRLTFTRSHITGALFFYLLVEIAATFFSLDPNTSLSGTQGRVVPSLLTSGILAIFYLGVLMTLTNSKHKGQEDLGAIKSGDEKMLISLVIGLSLGAFITLLAYFGLLSTPLEITKLTEFSTFGLSTVNVGTLAAIALVLSLNLILNAASAKLKAALVVTTIPTAILLLIYNIQISYIILIAGIIITAAVTQRDLLTKNKAYVANILIIFGLSAIVLRTQLIPAINLEQRNLQYGIELTHRASWDITAKSMINRPLIGTGLGTFYINYNLYKPLVINLTEFWDTTFVRPSAYLFTIINDKGLLGVISILILSFGVLREAYKGRNRVLTSLTLTMLIAVLITPLSVIQSSILLVALALLAKNGGKLIEVDISYSGSQSSTSPLISDKNVQQLVSSKAIFLTGAAALLVAIGIVSYGMMKTYLTELHANNAQTALLNNDVNSMLNSQALAIKHSPRKDELRNTLAQVANILANNALNKEEPTDEDKQEAQVLLEAALREVALTTEVLNPANTRGWELRASILSQLIGGNENALEATVIAYDRAISLNPNNPRLKNELAKVLLDAKEVESAANLFEQAVGLKPNYVEANYNLAMAHIMLEKYNKAYERLERVREALPQDAEENIKQIDEIMKQIEPLLTKTDDTDETEVETKN